MTFTCGKKLVTLRASSGSKLAIISAMKFEREMRKTDQLFLLQLCNEEQNEESNKVMHKGMAKLLEQYKEVFDMPKCLPPKRKIDHAIELEPNAKVVNKPPYRLSKMEKNEVAKHN